MSIKVIEEILHDRFYSGNVQVGLDSFVRLMVKDPFRKGANYILTSEPRCLRQMCSVKLRYNGTLSTRTSGCLSFSLRTRGQPGE